MDRVAFVTGASRGIGRATAVALARVGYDVAVSARTLVDGSARFDDTETVLPGGLDTTVEAIEAAGGRGFAVTMDLLDRTSVIGAANAALDHYGRIDLLVNNGIYQGPGRMSPLLELRDRDLTALFEGNVFAHIGLIRHLLPTFVAQGGATVMNMISATAHTDPPGKIGDGGWGMGYAMTKAAFERVAPLLQVEHGDDGVVAYSIDPGHVVTERMALSTTAQGYEKHFRATGPDVIGAAIAWLATDPDAPREYGGKIVFAQREAKVRNLV